MDRSESDAMLKTKTICVPLLAFFLTSATSLAFAADLPAYDTGPFALPDLGSPLHLAEAEKESPDIKSSTSEECLAFAKDSDADLGEVLRAGCEPTLGQMSALMDNPLGNVAMWINQYDSYHLRNDANGEDAIQGNYMGILQFPTGINEDWNLINRVIYNVASAPLDQDKVDDLTNNPPGTPPGPLS